jgi:hypothetical protein
MLVVSFWIALAIPKSMSLSSPLTSKKLAGFKSECTIRSSWIVFTASNICCNKPQMRMLETLLWEPVGHREQSHEANSCQKPAG